MSKVEVMFVAAVRRVRSGLVALACLAPVTYAPIALAQGDVQSSSVAFLSILEHFGDEIHAR